MVLTAKIAIALNITNTNPLDLSTPEDIIALVRGLNLTDGTGADQAQVLFHDTRTLADGANETIDIQDGTLTDAFGTAVTIEKLKGLYIKNNSTDANLLVGGAAATPIGLFVDTTDKAKIPPGGEYLYTAPDATGLDTSINAEILIAHDGTGSSSLTYDIIAVGVD